MGKKTFSGKFWFALTIFSLMGQVAWVVENMYFNLFIYKMFHASAADISLMVGASSVAAAATTILVGAFSDYVGKRKIFICGGYIAWGISILTFAFIRVDLLAPVAGGVLEAASLGVTLVIIMDCVMTFLGSSANDACFNAWMTDWGDDSNRGKIEGINSMMPLIATLVVFGGFSAFDLDRPESWTVIYLIVGFSVVLIGILGTFLIEEKGKPDAKRTPKTRYFDNLLYSFRPSVMKENPLLYVVIGAFAVFGISINIFMPYLILYYEKTLGMTDYVLIMAPAIIIAAVFTAFYGRLYDLLGFKMSVVPAVALLMAGYVILYLGKNYGVVFAGSLLMMSGYLSGMAVFGAMIRSNIPEKKAGQFQGIRIIGQVLIPGIIGPAIGAAVLHNAEKIVNEDGTSSFLPNRNIYGAAFGVAALLLAVLWLIFKMMREGHNRLFSVSGEKLLAEMAEDKNTGVWKQYPRPQMQRDSFVSLNGTWRLNGQEILVPFPPQSELSGFQGRIGTRLEYSRIFTIYRNEKTLLWNKQNNRILLHFGAVDQVAEVFVNDHFAGGHEGGYLPFCFDITEYVQEGENRLTVKVKDTLSARYPYGKQRKNRGGMWYTPVSGIWQSVWLEAVPQTHIEKLDITADRKNVNIIVTCSGDFSGDSAVMPLTVAIRLHDGSRYTIPRENITLIPSDTAAQFSTDIGSENDKAEAAYSRKGMGRKPEKLEKSEKATEEPESEYKPIRNSSFEIRIQANADLASIRLADGRLYTPILWTPENPYLYEMTISLGNDTVSSYFGLRTVEIRKADGIPCVCLNEKPIFLHGVLDQGYFCDGIYLPAAEEEYQKDILRMKELEFNLLRKHIKIEPECFYHYCDTHGMLVMQDMVNSGIYSWIKDTALPTIGIFSKGNGKLWGRRRRREFFVEHMKDTIAHLRNHPSVIAYTIFNEGWGQFDSDAMYELAAELDGTRLYDATSGWFPRKKSDFDSQHIYFRKLNLPENPEKPVLVSECGGYSLCLPEHIYAKFSRYGYGDCADEKELTERIEEMYEKTILPAVSSGLCGCIYTQLSDVEDETNGLYTYDRKVCKVYKGVMQKIAQRLAGAVSCGGVK